MGVDVPMAVQVSRRESRVGHSIDLRQALAGYVLRIQKSERSPSHQQVQRIEFAALALCQRRCGSERAAEGEIEVKAERESRARDSSI